MRDLYIYYKVAEREAPALWPRVQALQAELARGHGLAGQLRRRPEASDGQQTWMEIYPDAPPGIEALLADAFAAAGIAVGGPRHTEVFTDDSPCA
jgi:hypothetical protein